MTVPLEHAISQLARLRKQNNGILDGADVASILCAANATNLFDVLSTGSNVAVLGGDADDDRDPLTHAEIYDLISSLDLPGHGIAPGVRVGVIVSNGPELAVLLVALLTTAAVVPINSAGSVEEFTSEIIACSVDVIITDDEDTQRLAALVVLANELTLPLLVLNKDKRKAGAFKLSQSYRVVTHHEGGLSVAPSSFARGALAGGAGPGPLQHQQRQAELCIRVDSTLSGGALRASDLKTVHSGQTAGGASQSDSPQSVFIGYQLSGSLPESLSGAAAAAAPPPPPPAAPSAAALAAGPPSLAKLRSIRSIREQRSASFKQGGNAALGPSSTLSSYQSCSSRGLGILETAAGAAQPRGTALKLAPSLARSAGSFGDSGGGGGGAAPRFGSASGREFAAAGGASMIGRDSSMRTVSAASSHGIFATGSPGVRLLNGLQDNALILQTSGSTGTKKVVPYTLEAVLVGVCSIAASQELSPGDVIVNMMPLFHAGGIFRNVLAPLLAGAATCCMPMFDPCQFWRVVQDKGATIYYAAPTMHMAILDALADMDAPPRHSIRLIANAAGPLLPATAEALKATFKGAAIMPSYGMTECMPISAPPSNYQLEKTGTSGQPLGPKIKIGSDKGQQLPSGSIGEIMIRGLPLFRGYDGNPQATEEAFTDGWFKTGDLGYQDDEGYLYITGRSKDVINRGGEIISPAEVESAAMQMPGVRAAAAFPVNHDKLQEAIGLVLVAAGAAEDGGGAPSGPLLPQVVEFLSGVLHPSKWPFVLVYMDDLPKGPTGKVVRTGLAKRLSLPDFTDGTPLAARHFQAQAPGAGAAVSSNIPCAPAAGVDERLQQLRGPGGAGGGARTPASRLEQACVEMTAQVVGLKPSEVSPDDDFFLIGGSSMNASQLASLLRKKFQVAFTGLTIFTYRTPSDMAAYLLEQRPDLQEEGWTDPPGAPRRGAGAGSGRLGAASTLLSTASRMLSGIASGGGGRGRRGKGNAAAAAAEARPDPSVRPHVLLVQAIPLLFLLPLRRICSWMLVFVLWYAIGHQLMTVRTRGGHNQLWALLLAIMAMNVIRTIVLPLVGIAAKWAIVGRYKEGRYKLWGGTYLRWWIAERIISLSGHGFFSLTPGLARTYLRLMGGKVGKGVTVNILLAHLGEYDLLTLEDDAVVDKRAYVRPFCVDGGHMMLAPITLGRGSCVCVNGVVAPGTSVPAGAGVGPNGCSLEPLGDAAELRKFCAVAFPGPPLWLVPLGYLLRLMCSVAALAPIVVLLLVVLPSLRSPLYPFTRWQNVVLWLVDKNKIAVFMMGAIMYAGLCPFIYLLMVIIIKRTVIGKFTPGPRSRSSWQLFRHWLMGLLIHSGGFGGVLNAVGAHWAPVTWIYRALGAKIGERVFWPGGGLHGIVEYDLLTIEDDCIFGSRSTYMLCDAEEALPITIRAGGNVADRCTLLPGAVVGVNACLGTGGVLGKGQQLEAGAVAVGCQGGSAVVITPGSKDAESAPTLKPYGRAQYLRQSSYWLPPSWAWVGFNWLVAVTESVYTRSRMVFAWLIVYRLLDFQRHAAVITLGHYFGVMLGVYSCLHIAYTAFSLVGVCIGAKWLIIGLRKPGAYNWDESSYWSGTSGETPVCPAARPLPLPGQWAAPSGARCACTPPGLTP